MLALLTQGAYVKTIATSLLLFSCLFCRAAEPKMLISPQEIAAKIEDAGRQIDADYNGEELTIVMVMKGAVCLASDLIRTLKTPTLIEYIKASSYGQNGAVRGALTIHGLDSLDLSSKHVLVVDDIFDSGFTMEGIVAQLQQKNPKSIKTLVLLSKNIERKTAYRPDYVLFDIDDHFVVGYGLDYKEKYRGLPGIYYFD